MVAVVVFVRPGALLGQLGLGIGVGLHSGPVIEGLMGSADVKAYGFVGDTINTARRICDHARRGEILVSKAACAAQAPSLELAEERSFKAKGKQELLQVFSIAWPRPG